MFADDFTGLGNLIESPVKMAAGAAQGKGIAYPGGGLQAWHDIGGSIGAISDIAMAAGMFTEDVGTGGIATPADIPEAAGYAGVRAGLRSFAMGTGKGLAGQAVSSAASTFAKEKGKGASTGKAAVEGAISGVTTAVGFKVMNKLGPTVANTFTRFLSGLKIAPYIQNVVDKVSETLQGAAQSSKINEMGDYVKTSLNAAASDLMKGNFAIFKTMVENLKSPSNDEVTALANRVQQNVGILGNMRVATLFGQAKQRLAPFVISSEDAMKLLSEVPAGAAHPTDAEIAAEVGRMAKAGESAGLSSEQMSAQASSNLINKKNLLTLSQDAETPIYERVTPVLVAATKGGNASVSDLLDAMNVAPEAAKESKFTSDLWNMIRMSVGNDPEGKAALADYENARAARAAQDIHSSWASDMEQAAANPVVGQPGKPQLSWQNFVSTVWDKLKTPQDALHLQQVFGNAKNMATFGKMLSKKIIYDAINAYRIAAGSVRAATPSTAKAGADAFQKTITDYTHRLTNLPGIMDGDTIKFLEDMAHGIPDVQTIAKNSGIDFSTITDEAGKPLFEAGAAAQKLSEQEMNTIADSPIGKFLAKAGTDFRGLPDALLKSSPEALSALKKSMNPQDWEKMGALTLGRIMQKMVGLWGTTDKKAIEDTLHSISAKVEGDKQVFQTLFGSEGGPVLKTLIAYGNAMRDSGITAGGKIKAAASNAASSATFAFIHHYYIAAVLASKAFKDLVGEEDATLLTDLSQMSKSDLNAAYRKVAGEVGGVRGFMTKISNAIINGVMPIVKYEVGNNLPQIGVPNAVQSVTTGGGTSSEPSASPLILNQ